MCAIDFPSPTIFFLILPQKDLAMIDDYLREKDLVMIENYVRKKGRVKIENLCRPLCRLRQEATKDAKDKKE